jgi:hypothetical protein
MDNPAARELMEMVRRFKEISQGGGSRTHTVEDYLRAVSADPTTQWFTELLREKSDELDKERRQADQLACALQAWYRAKQEGTEHSAGEADLHLVQSLQAMGIIAP